MRPGPHRARIDARLCGRVKRPLRNNVEPQLPASQFRLTPLVRSARNSIGQQPTEASRSGAARLRRLLADAIPGGPDERRQPELRRWELRLDIVAQRALHAAAQACVDARAMRPW